jgi:hypothetical protein
MGVETQVGVERLEHSKGELAEQPGCGRAYERQDEVGVWRRCEAEERSDFVRNSASADQTNTLATLRKLIGELHRDAAAKRVADHGHSFDIEDGQEIAHRVGIGGDRVVGSGLVRLTVSKQIGRDDGVIPSERWNDVEPAVRAVSDAMNQ